MGSHSLLQGIFPTHGLNPDLLHYLVSQLVKNLPAVREAWIQSLGWDDPLEKGFPLQYSGLENSMDYIVHGVAKSRTQLSIFHFHFLIELKTHNFQSLLNFLSSQFSTFYEVLLVLHTKTCVSISLLVCTTSLNSISFSFFKTLLKGVFNESFLIQNGLEDKMK